MMNRRRHARLAMTLPMRARLRGHDAPELETTTKDISSSGLYFTLSRSFEIGSEIECRIDLLDESAGNVPVMLRCHGKIVRVERPDADNRIGIAATIEEYQLTQLAKAES